MDRAFDLPQDASTRALLDAVEANITTGRKNMADRLHLVLAWCDRYSDDPQTRPGAVPRSRGGDQLLHPGGEGSPGVTEFALSELAVALQVGHIAARNLAADALDLRHRFPGLYYFVGELRVETWAARRIVTLARHLTLAAARGVDAIVAAQVHQAPGRLIEIAEAAIIAADPDTHRARLAQDATRTGVWLSKNTRPGQTLDPVEGEPATRRFTGRLSLEGAVELDQTIEDLADALAAETTTDGHPDGDAPTRDQLRAQALELLADPHAAVKFLNGPTEAPENAPAEPAGDSPAPTAPPARGSAVIHLHLGSLAENAVADVEGLGPMLIEQAARLLRNKHITIQPILDLAAVTAVDSYHHPQTMRDRVYERTGGEVWPHSASRTRRLDYDHVTPYPPPDQGGPSGQTTDTNTAPLTRTHHRYKTHAGYTCEQLQPGVYRWTTPHGLNRIVTPTGTRTVITITDEHGLTTDWYDGPTINIDNYNAPAGGV